MSILDVYVEYLLGMFNFKENYTDRTNFFIIIAIQAITLSLVFCLGGAEYYFFGTSILAWATVFVAVATLLANISLVLHRFCDVGLSYPIALSASIILTIIPVVGWIILLILASLNSNQFISSY